MDYFHRHYAGKDVILSRLPSGFAYVLTSFRLLFVHKEPSERLSLERAREYDRVSEVLAARGGSTDKLSDDGSDKGTPSPYGMDARRKQFDKNSYKQPVLTQKPMLPRRYRRGHNDRLTFECRAKLQAYALMNDTQESL